MAVTAQDLDLTEHQFGNARGIIKAVRKRNLPVEVAYIALSTTLAESGLNMYASANVPESQKYAHAKVSWTSDGLGHDHASMGMFQQQTGCRWTTDGCGTGMTQSTMGTEDGWGPPSVLMDPVKSTDLFLNALEAKGWKGKDPWVAAQDVQGSAYDGNPRDANHMDSRYGGNYRDTLDRAKQIADTLWMENLMATLDNDDRAFIETCFLRLGNWLASGSTNSLFNPTLAGREWIKDPNTITLNDLHNTENVGIFGNAPDNQLAPGHPDAHAKFSNEAIFKMLQQVQAKLDALSHQP